MLSEPIVLQKLHLFFSCIVYWWCGSGRRLDGHNYAAPQPGEKTAFPYTWISVFLTPKVRRGWINMFILFGCGPQSFMQTLGSTAPTVTYSCKCDAQVTHSQRWPIHKYPFCLFGLGFWFRAEITFAEKVSNQNPFALNRQTGLCLKTSSKTFRDVSAIDSEYFVFLPNTMRRAQWLFHKAASCHTFDCCCSEAHRLDTSNSVCLALGSSAVHVWSLCGSRVRSTLSDNLPRVMLLKPMLVWGLQMSWSQLA